LETSLEQASLGPRIDVELLRVDSIDEADDRLEDADAVIAWHHLALPRAALTRLRRCQAIVRASVGVDNIDLEAAAELGIAVYNVPDYGTEEVADHTLALLLTCARRIPALAAAGREGDWRWQTATGARRLRGRHLAIVGLGRIGTAVACRAKAFGLAVSFYDPYLPSGAGKALGVARAESLDELLRDADLLTLHAPLTPETHAMIGREELALIGDDAIVVNTARGALIDNDALEAALRDGHVAAAGLDVVAGEPAVPPALADREDVLLTCHAAFYSVEALLELREKAARAVRRVLIGSCEERSLAQRDEISPGGPDRRAPTPVSRATSDA
jgi:phosphoglycerate dehydrogenase-like enzyme